MAKKTLSVPVRVIVEDHPETRFRELCMIVEDRPEIRSVPVDLKTLVLHEGIDHLERLRWRYASVKELEPVWDELDRIRESVQDDPQTKR
jgi:hypothetical protein